MSTKKVRFFNLLFSKCVLLSEPFLYYFKNKKPLFQKYSVQNKKNFVVGHMNKIIKRKITPFQTDLTKKV